MTNSLMQASAGMFLENIKPKTPALLAKAVSQSCSANKKQGIAAPKKFLPDEDDEDDDDDDGDVICLGKVDDDEEEPVEEEEEEEKDDEDEMEMEDEYE